MTITKGEIGNALTSVASDHILAVANDIYDEKIGDYQENINKKNSDDINDLTEEQTEINNKINQLSGDTTTAIQSSENTLNNIIQELSGDTQNNLVSLKNQTQEKINTLSGETLTKIDTLSGSTHEVKQDLRDLEQRMDEVHKEIKDGVLASISGKDEVKVQISGNTATVEITSFDGGKINIE